MRSFGAPWHLYNFLLRHPTVRPAYLYGPTNVRADGSVTLRYDLGRVELGGLKSSTQAQG
jgi:hypothetical protein